MQDKVGTMDSQKDRDLAHSELLHKRRRVVMNAIIMSFGTLVTRVFGLLREVLFAAYFSRTVTDAWYVAFRIPNLFRRLFGEGSLSVSFVPVFVDAHTHDYRGGPGGVRAHNLVNAFYTIFLIFLATLSVLGIVFAEPLVTVFVDGQYLQIPGKLELTVRMSQIMFSYVFLVCTYAYFMAILNALGNFGLAAMAPAFMNIALITGTVMPQSWLEWDGQAVSWAVIIGGVFQAGVLMPSLYRLGYLPRLTLNLRNPDVARVGKAMLPGLFGLGLLQFTTLINTRFASSLGEGPVTYISLADRLLELPLSLVSVSIGSALLPILSQLWSEKSVDEFKATVNSNLRLNILLSAAAGTGLYMLALPIVEMLFQRRNFSASEAVITSNVVRVYSLLVITSSCVRVLVPSFYAIKNTWVPAIISTVCLVVHVLLAPQMMARWGLTGLNFSSVVTAGLNLSLLLVSFHRIFGDIGYARLFESLWKTAGCCALLALGLMSHVFLRQLLGFSFAAQVVEFLAATLCGVGLFLAGGYLFRVQEMNVITARLLGKARKKLG